MNNAFNENNLHESDVHSLAAVVREIRLGLSNVVKNDIQLAKAEMKATTGYLKRDMIQLAAFGGIAALGIFPFLAFLVVGLGDILGGRYWLSALIWSVVFFGVGGGMVYAAVKRLQERDVSFSHTRRAIDNEISVVDRKLHKLSEVTKSRTNTMSDQGRAA